MLGLLNKDQFNPVYDFNKIFPVSSLGGGGLGAVSSYSVKFQMSELVSGDSSQRQFVRSWVNLNFLK